VEITSKNVTINGRPVLQGIFRDIHNESWLKLKPEAKCRT